MRRINNPERIKWKALSERPTINLENLNQTVNQVFDEIQKEGDKAVKKYTHFFDRVDMENFEVPIESINNSSKEISKESAFFKRSILVSESISEGDLLSPKNIRIARPGDGLCPSYWDQVLGKSVRRNLCVGHPLSLDDINTLS